jgi:uncharacterized membrane protein YvlD (DUF360 family)
MRDGIFLRFVIRWVVSTVAVAVTTWLLQPHIRIEGAEYLSTVILVGLVLGLLNALVRPIIIFLTLPATLVTFGLFLIVINAGMLWLTDLLGARVRDREFRVGAAWGVAHQPREHDLVRRAQRLSYDSSASAFFTNSSVVVAPVALARATARRASCSLKPSERVSALIASSSCVVTGASVGSPRSGI